jgi:hypothetical protein
MAHASRVKARLLHCLGHRDAWCGESQEGAVMLQQRDDEFTFRPRRRLRGPISVIVLMVTFAGGLWFAYSAGTDRAPAEVPVLHADDGANKKRPDQPGGMNIPDRDKCILDFDMCGDRGKGARTVNLRPPPETPVPRPAPPPPSLDDGAPASSPEPPLPATVRAPAATTMRHVVQTPPRTVLTARPRAAPLAVADPLQTPPPVGSAGKAGGYRLQIGAVRSEALAQQEWDRLKKAQKDLLAGISAGWTRADLGERGMFYRILAGPIGDPAAAARICGELKKRSVRCIVVRA